MAGAVKARSMAQRLVRVGRTTLGSAGDRRVFHGDGTLVEVVVDFFV